MTIVFVVVFYEVQQVLLVNIVVSAYLVDARLIVDRFLLETGSVFADDGIRGGKFFDGISGVLSPQFFKVVNEAAVGHCLVFGLFEEEHSVGLAADSAHFCAGLIVLLEAGVAAVERKFGERCAHDPIITEIASPFVDIGNYDVHSVWL